MQNASALKNKSSLKRKGEQDQTIQTGGGSLSDRKVSDRIQFGTLDNNQEVNEWEN